MRSDTKQGFHFGTNFLFAPAAGYEPAALLQFQQSLAQTSTLVFDQTQRTPTGMALVRQGPPLHVTIGLVGPGIGQLLIAAPQPARPLISFIEDAEMIVNAYRGVWPGPLQIVRRDCTLRYLYAVREGHATEFLWEKRLRPHRGDPRALWVDRSWAVAFAGHAPAGPCPGRRWRRSQSRVFPVRLSPAHARVPVRLGDSRSTRDRADPRPLIEAVDAFIDGPLTQFTGGRGGDRAGD